MIDGASNYFGIEPVSKNGSPKTMAIGNERYTPPDSGFYMTDAFTAYALRWLDEHKPETTPFFLYLAYTAPHRPLHAWPQDIARYSGSYSMGWDLLREKRFRRMREIGVLKDPWGKSDRNGNVPPWDSLSGPEKEIWEKRMTVYAAMSSRRIMKDS